MACQVFRNDTGSITSVTAPNGQESKLYKNILSVQPDPEAALKLWAQVYTPSFKRWFGDWQANIPQPGYTRLYRGETSSENDSPIPDWLKSNPDFKSRPKGTFFSATKEEAEYYDKKFGDGTGRITYIDIPTIDLEKYRASNNEGSQFSARGMAEVEYFVPNDISKDRKQLIVSSKVVDENGEPLLMFNGSGVRFDSFDKSKLFTGEGAAIYGAGFYFTDNRNSAQGYKNITTKLTGLGYEKRQLEQLLKRKAQDINAAEAFLEKYKKMRSTMDELESKIKGFPWDLNRSNYKEKGYTEQDANNVEQYLEMEEYLIDQASSPDPSDVYSDKQLQDFKESFNRYEKRLAQINELVSTGRNSAKLESGFIFDVFLNIKNPFQWEKEATQQEIDAFNKELAKRNELVRFKFNSRSGTVRSIFMDFIFEYDYQTTDNKGFQYTDKMKAIFSEEDWRTFVENAISAFSSRNTTSEPLSEFFAKYKDILPGMKVYQDRFNTYLEGGKKNEGKLMQITPRPGLTLGAIYDRIADSIAEPYARSSRGSINTRHVTELLQNLGYDGVLHITKKNYYHPYGRFEQKSGEKHYVAFESNEIKSVFNKGTYSEDNDNIYLQKERQSEKATDDNLDKKIREFLSSIGVNISTLDTIRDKDGNLLDAVAKANMLNRIIEIANGRADITTLSEEAAHFFVELLGENNPLYKSMFDKITGYKIYQQTVNQYKNLALYRNKDGTVNFNKIKKEAMGKLIMAFIVKQETGEEVSDKVNTAKTWWASLWEFISSLFKKATTNPFQQAASELLGNDTSNLDVNKVLEDEDYLQAGSTLFGVDKLLDDQTRIKLDDSVDPKTNQKRHLYTRDGKPVVDKDGNGRSVNSVYVDAWYKSRFPTDNRSERDKNIDNLKAEEGTKLHADMQDIITRFFNPDGTRRAAPLANRKVSSNDVVYNKLETYFLQLLDQYKDPGVKFLSEVKIYDPEKNVAGTIDLVIVHPDNTVDIYDWKSQQIGKDQEELKWFKAPAYRIQLEAYKRILQKHYGFAKFGKLRAIPMRTNFNMKKDAGGYTPTSLKDIEVGHANPAFIPKDKNYLLPVVMLYESTGNKSLDSLIAKLNTIYDRLNDTKVRPSEKDLKAEELNDIAKTIRDLQVRKDITSFVDNGIYELTKYNKKLSDGSLDIYNIMDAIETMKIYASSQEFLSEQIIDINKQIKLTQNPDEKQFLVDSKDKLLEMQANSKYVLDRLIEKRDSLGDEFARGEGINTLLNTEKSMDFLKRNFRSLSTLDTAAMNTFYVALRRAQAIRDTKINEMMKEMGKIQSDYMDWARKKGKTGTDMFDFLLEIDDKGNWNGDFLNIYSKAFFAEKDKAIKRSDIKWLRDNTEFDQAAYDEKRKEQIAMLEERYPGTDQSIAKKRDVLLVKWEEKHSSKYDYAYLNKKNYFIKPKVIWQSDKYKFINEKGNEPLRAAYDYFQKMIRTSTELGMIDKFSSKFIPSLVKGTELSPKAILDSMLVESDQGFGKIDNLTGQLKKEIPVYFTRDLGKKKDDGTVDYSSKSRDLFTVFGTWGNQMYNFEAMQSLEDMSRALLEIERSKSSFAQNMFGKVDKNKKIENNDVNTKVLENFINYYLYGQNTHAGFDKAIKIKGKEYSAMKGGQKLLKLMAVKTLGLNYLSGTATFVGGTANAWFQASKRTIFTEKEWMQGVRDYTGKNEVTMAAIYQIGLGLENHRAQELRNLSVSGVMKHANTDALMYIQRKGDRWATFPVAAAMLNIYMVDDQGKVVNIRDHVKAQNNYNNFYNLSEADRKALTKKMDKEIEELQKTKSIKATAKVVNDKLVIPGITDNESNMAAFRGAVQKNLKLMIGNATKDDINQIRMTLLGQTLMQFRSWMPQMMTERFGDMSYDIDTDTWNYGKARLFMKHLFTKEIFPLLKELMVGFGTNTIQKAKQRYAEFVIRLQEEGRINDPSEFMSEAEFIDMYLGNLRSAYRELMMMLAFFSMLLWAVGGDDDDDKTGIRKFLAKAFDKYYNEFAFYYSPGEFMQMVKNPIPIQGLFRDFESLGKQTVGQIWGFGTGNDEIMDENRPLKYIFKILPITKELQSTYAYFDDDFRKEFDIR